MTFRACIEQCLKIDAGLVAVQHEKLTTLMHYIQNHWEAIVLRLQNEICGSCIEAPVSHILSDRLSRIPLAWSEHGLRQMAMLRVYTKNGGVVTEKDVRVLRSKAELQSDKHSHENGYAKYRALADRQIHDFLCAKTDWSIFAPAPGNNGKLNAIGILKKAYAALQNPLTTA